MKTVFNVFEPGQAIATVRLDLAALIHCRNALLERRNRQNLRAKLDGLSDRELLDIGIGRGESTASPAIALSTAQRRPPAVNRTARRLK